MSSPGHAILSDFGGIGGGPSQGVSGCQGTDSCYLHALIASNFVSGTRAYSYGGEGICMCGALVVVTWLGGGASTTVSSADMDENSAGVTIVGNVAGDVSGASLYTHCGANYSIQGNILFGSHAVGGSSFDPATFAACNTGGVPPQFENESKLHSVCFCDALSLSTC